jgi:RNA polymerase sigma factor (TIGR02999 family)
MPGFDDPDLTRVLASAVAGDAAARDHFVEAVYQQLRRLAAHVLRNERPGQTLQTTALVNEALLRFFGNGIPNAENRRHFLNVAARQMRRILIDRARLRNADRRQGVQVSVENLALKDAGKIAIERSAELVALDDALNALAEVDARAADVVEKKYFGGYTDEETADVLGINVAQVRRDWTYARTWLHDYLSAP